MYWSRQPQNMITVEVGDADCNIPRELSLDAAAGGAAGPN